MPLSEKLKKQIVKEELEKLKENNYISAYFYDEVVKAHEMYYLDLVDKTEKKAAQPKPEKRLKPKVEKRLKPNHSKAFEKKTDEQIRERNITWLLNIGVILLLIGGLYVATSNWETMSSATKAGSIGLISFLFYGIAYLAMKVLKLDKTGFAFIVLGSLFLPIFLLSIAWFQLLGSYLSIYGEGSYLFALISCILLLPVYFLFAKRMKSRLFVWFTYITLTVGTGYFFAALHFSEDIFFLGMMLFQALTIYLYHQVKKKDVAKLFIREFVNFAQANLILTTVLMLVLYHSNMFLGFNLMLTAAVYLSMIYVTGRKEFHFVFSVMLVYGVFQFVQASVFVQISPVLYSLLGFIFLLIPFVLDQQYPWKKIFMVTSAVVSGLAFIYISLEAILINWGEPSLTLLLSYFAISINFLYLSHATQKLLFRYLSAVFMSVVLVEGVLLFKQFIELTPFVLILALIGFVMFAGFGVYVKVKVLELMKQPARDVGWAYMLVAVYASLSMYAWWESAVILFLFSICAYISIVKETREELKRTAQWLVPISIGLAVLALYEELIGGSHVIMSQLGPALQFACASLGVTGLYFFIKIPALKRNHCYTAQAFYTLALLTGTVVSSSESWIHTLLFVGGIVMYVWLYHFTKNRYIPYVIGLVILMSYYTLVDQIWESGILFAITGAAILFVIAILVKARDLNVYRAFAFVAHMYMPSALLLTLFIHGKSSMWSFWVAALIYGVSTILTQREWLKKFFLYGSFTSIYAAFTGALAHFETIELKYGFILTSLAIAVIWKFSDEAYKQRIFYYIVPFSLLGIGVFLNMYPFHTFTFIIMILYAVGMMVFFHIYKWKMLVVIPTLFIYAGVRQYLVYYPFTAWSEMLTIAVFGLVFLAAGRWFFTAFYENKKKGVLIVDVYTLIALLYFATMYSFEHPFLWTRLLPGSLIALTIWLQRNRIPSEYKWLPIFISGAFLLQPYYSFVSALAVHELLITEVYVLPFVLLSIYLRFCLKGRYERVTANLQWGILLVVSIFLVVDGLQSSTIYDALILGTLSLASIVAGVFAKIKSFFFIGTGVLLLNVFMQTRPFWGNLPWWAYLLIAGSILIAVASINEWNKQKAASGEKTLLFTLKERVKKLWIHWK
ncbi:hypothetical protein [Robertmurraya sp. DFI.2.37]|uniref:hypothetical protein n=1 Tax=Robertmurraya sp. DFI.2.37 TaxID=3031819 RepID=UPI0012443B3C|nr:hypothetical protein [Robertmurraya sp. DFI.2.37]